MQNASQCSLSHFSTPCESTPSSLLLGQRRLTAKRVPLWESSLVLEAVSQPPFEFQDEDDAVACSCISETLSSYINSQYFRLAYVANWECAHL